MSKLSDEWQTPIELFNYLDDKYRFFWDACCNMDNCLSGYQKFNYSDDKYKDYLKNDMNELFKDHGTDSRSIFMNPPYSNPGPFITKAWEDAKHFKIVILVPTSILSCKYMDILDTRRNTYERDWKRGVTVIPLNRRIQFVHPSKVKSSSPAGSMLLILDRRSDFNE